MKRYIRLFALVLIAFIAFSMFSVLASAKTADEAELCEGYTPDLSYAEEIKPYFYPEIFGGRDTVWGIYDMLYAHNAESGESPEYVVFKAIKGGDAAILKRQIGDYIVTNYSYDSPYDLAHYVYVPAQQKVYTLEEAWASEDLDITAAFRLGYVGQHIRDFNDDGIYDILDATYTQCYLVGMDGYSKKSKMDFNGSSDVNIFDVTAIQLELAGLA